MDAGALAGPATWTEHLLHAVAAVAANDVWAVGATWDHILAEHWDGQQWSVVPTSNPLGGDILRDVEARAANDVWAVGYAFNGPSVPLVDIGIGTSWTPWRIDLSLRPAAASSTR